MKSSIRRFWVIVILFLISLYIAFPQELPINMYQWPKSEIIPDNLKINTTINKPPLDIKIGNFQFTKNYELHLGLDLAGGSHLVFEADAANLPQDDKQAAVDAARETIERRVNIFGVSEAQVLTSKVGESYRIIADLPGVKDTKQAIDLIGQTAQLDFKEIIESPEATSGSLVISDQTTVSTGFTGADLKRARPGFDQTSGKPIVEFEIKSESVQKFGEITQRLIGRPLVIFLDGIPQSAPTVNSAITGGSGIITGDFTAEETKRLAGLLNSGALPVPIKIIEQRTVEANLGAESVRASVIAGLVGLLMVVLFMTLYYGRLGVLAVLGLIVYGLVTLALYKLIPIVLTLPGIAGFILSVGMAVDSNILIFERLKEELRAGKSYQNALESAFGRAWDSIRDANIATLVTVFVLFNPFNFEFLHTSGPVRGFALTLGLGIAVSLYTGIFVTRTLLRLSARKGKE